MGLKLLLADDSVTIQRVIELTFADEDIDVQVVGDGVQAIEQIKSNAPDIVLADTSMPEKDGYDVAAFVKNDPTLARIPVVLLTGAFEPLDTARAETVGSAGVLVKPFEPQQVIGKVRELLASAAEPTAPDAVAAFAPAPSSTDPAPEAAGHASPPPVVETPVAPMTPPASQTVSSAPAKPRLDDGELADYFDQLDEAFASTEGPSGAGPVPGGAPTRTPAPASTSTVGPPLEDTGRQSEVVPSVAPSADLDRLDLEALVEDAAKADALAAAPLVDAPAPKPAPPPTPPAAAFVSPPPTPPAAAVVSPPPTPPAAAVVSPPTVASEPAPLSVASSPVPETALPESAGGSPIGEVASETVSASPVPGPASAAAPPQYAAGSVLAQAFATYLAVEQGAPPPRLAPAGAEAADTPLPEAMVDDVVQRVVARMTDSIVRDTTADIVSEVAERLVRDEIDRIKTGAK